MRCATLCRADDQTPRGRWWVYLAHFSADTMSNRKTVVNRTSHVCSGQGGARGGPTWSGEGLRVGVGGAGQERRSSVEEVGQEGGACGAPLCVALMIGGGLSSTGCTFQYYHVTLLYKTTMRLHRISHSLASQTLPQESLASETRLVTH